MHKFLSTKKRKVVAIIVAAFLVFFLFNLLRGFGKAHVSDAEIAKNIQTIESLQQAEVATIEDAVSKLDRASKIDESASKRIRYRRTFSKSIILGDSLTEGLTVYNWLTTAQVSAKVGGSIVYADEQFQTAAKTYPEFAFFAFGMNDMGNYGGDEKAFIKKYSQLLADFQATSPDTKICVCSISTPTEKAQSDNHSISYYKKFNEAIAKLCEDKGYTFIDIADILPSHPDLYAGDGIHADPTYYPIWMDRMIERAGM